MAHGTNSESFKRERQERQNNCKKIYYIPNEIKHSDSGLAFEGLFKPIYTRYLDEAESMIETLSHEKDSFIKQATEEALDYVFDIEPKCDCNGKRYLFIDEEFDDNKILEFAFKKLEEKFNNKFSDLVAEKRNAWRLEKFVYVNSTSRSSSLYSFAKNKAFVECYGQEFKELFVIASDNAMDEVMMNLITTEGYFDDEKDLEKQMSSSYKSILKTEVLKLSEQDGKLKTALSSLMEKILHKKFVANDIKYDRK